VLPETVTTISGDVFWKCKSLTSVVIPDSVTAIGANIFCFCTSLTSIKLSSNMTLLGSGFFSHCSSLSSVTLPSSITTLRAHVFQNCSSLTSLRLPTNLAAISRLAFEGCSELTTINAPSFSTTTFRNSPDELTYLLVNAGFLRINLSAILYGGSSSVSSRSDSDADMYYDMKTWGRKRDEDSGRLPLCTAAARSLTWRNMRQVFSVNMPVIHDADGMTGLPVFMLAAVGPTSDIESVYGLLNAYPQAIDGL